MEGVSYDLHIMTIAIAIRTGSAVVFAADSKLTTSGLLGFDQDGGPIWERQTYDNAVKVVHDRNQILMAMVAGVTDRAWELSDLLALKDEVIASRTSTQRKRHS